MLPCQQIPAPPLLNESLLPLFEERAASASEISEKDGNSKKADSTNSVKDSLGGPLSPQKLNHRGSRVSFSQERDRLNSSSTAGKK